MKKVTESLMGDRYMSEDEAREFIGNCDGDRVSDVDIIDEETGEVYLRAGDDFRTSPWNPDHRIDPKRAQSDRVYAHRANVPWHCPDCDARVRLGDDHTCIEDEVDTWESERESRYQAKSLAEKEYHKAVAEFCEQWEDAINDLGPDLTPEEAAPDAAEGFFWQFPKWEEWAHHLGMSRMTMKEVIADYVYDAMTRGRRDLDEGLIDPVTDSKRESEKSPVEADEMEDWVQRSAIPDDTGADNTKKFSEELGKTFGERQLSDEAQEALSKKYPKLVATLATQGNKQEAVMKHGRRLVEGRVPTSFDEFRLQFAAALKRSGAPEDLVAEVEDVGYMGSGPISPLWQEWEAISMDLKDEEIRRDVDSQGFADVFEANIYDAVLNMVDEYKNGMNYAPGYKPQKVDDIALANSVVENWGSKTKVGAGTASKAKKAMDDFVGQDPAQKVAENIAEALRIEGVTGCKVTPGRKNTDTNVDYYIDIPKSTDTPLPQLADFLLDEMTSSSASRNFGFKFEAIRTADSVAAAVDVEDPDGAFTITVVFDSLVFDHVGNILVNKSKF